MLRSEKKYPVDLLTVVLKLKLGFSALTWQEWEPRNLHRTVLLAQVRLTHVLSRLCLVREDTVESDRPIQRDK